jgi:hypothetical protein
MPKFIATNYNVTINGTDFSSSLASVELPIEVETQDTTAFGATFRTAIAGLQTGSITLEFHQDFGAGAIDTILYKRHSDSTPSRNRYKCNKPFLHWYLPCDPVFPIQLNSW